MAPAPPACAPWLLPVQAAPVCVPAIPPVTVVTTEPVYANNQPEHYAVANAYLGGGAEGGGEASGGGVDVVGSALLGAAGLSQRDLALSRKAEELLEQERRDEELARRLQEDITNEIVVHGGDDEERVGRRLLGSRERREGDGEGEEQ